MSGAEAAPLIAAAPKNDSLRGAVTLAHFFLRQRLRPGDLALDATCGNGLDTRLLAELTGPEGRVWGFDLQAAAIAATRALLEREGRLAQVTLIEAGHERLAEFAPAGLRAAVFNLGYLPGGDPAFTTSPASTLSALRQAASLLARQGIIVVSLYTGHEGGVEEALAVEGWGAALAPKEFNVWCSRQLNRPAIAPYLMLVERTR